MSPSPCPVASADAFAVVNVGNSAWLFRNHTPRVFTAFIAGAVSAVTIRPRRPSATNKMTLCGVVCAGAGAADSRARRARWRMIRP